FVPAGERPGGRRKGIAHSDTFAKGRVHVDAGAARALQAGGASLLAVGVTATDGDFERDDIVSVIAPDGSVVAWGRTAYGAAELAEAIGRPGLSPVIHADYLYTEPTHHA
ncbi:MAG: glutamate 5-kinase, partial [Muribaculaceae bacterium]|nr:glutamate 5-kinase [Muribaculaceae bacterium]